MAKKSASQKLEDLEKSDEELEQEKKAPKPDGVLFWHRLRAETSVGPRYFDDPAKAPAGAKIPEATFLRINDPDNPGKPLTIRGSRRIKDKNIIVYLILKNKPTAKASGGSKIGSILYDPDEVVESGAMTREELKNAAVKSIAPKWYTDPAAPPPNIEASPESELDRMARERNIPKYDLKATIFEKKARIVEFFKTGQ